MFHFNLEDEDVEAEETVSYCSSLWNGDLGNIAQNVGPREMACFIRSVLMHTPGRCEVMHSTLQLL